MKAIITVLGKDQVGIIAGVSSLLAKWNVNVLDLRLRQPDDFAGKFHHGHAGGSRKLFALFYGTDGKAERPRRGDGHCDPHAAGGHLQRNAQDLSGEGKNHAKPQ